MSKDYIIPQNYEDSMVTASGISIRNVIEGVILLGIVALAVWFLPLSLKIKIILIVIFGGGLGIFGVIGIHHCSLSEYLMLVIQYKMSERDLYKSKIFEFNDEFDNVENTSIIENIKTQEFLSDEENNTKGEMDNAKSRKRHKKHKSRKCNGKNQERLE